MALANLPPKIALALAMLQRPGLEARKSAMAYAAEHFDQLSNEGYSPHARNKLLDQLTQSQSTANQSLASKGVIPALKDFLGQKRSSQWESLSQILLQAFPQNNWVWEIKTKSSLSLPTETWSSFFLGLLLVLSNAQKSEIPINSDSGSFQLSLNGSLVHLQGPLDIGIKPGRLLREMEYWFSYPKSLAPSNEKQFYLIFDFTPTITESP
jgi:hypothetical protein